jgi:hypothetical protein
MDNSELLVRLLTSACLSATREILISPTEIEIFIENFLCGGFDNTLYPPAGLSSPNIFSTLPLMPIRDVLAGVLVVYGCDLTYSEKKKLNCTYPVNE